MIRLAEVIQPGSGKKFTVDDSQVKFWSSRGYEQVKTPARKPKSKPEK